MKPEVTLSESEMKNFCINVVNNYEGCEEAIVYLKKIYGENVDDLRKRKKDFYMLSNTNKAHWIINFLLNTITKPYRIQFYTQRIRTCLDICRDDVTKIKIINAMIALQNYAKTEKDKYYKEIVDFYNDFDENRKHIQRELQAHSGEKLKLSPDYFNSQMAQSQLFKSILLVMDKCKGSYTKDLTRAFQILAEAFQWHLISDPDQKDYHLKYLQDTSKELVDYVGYWMVTEKNGAENGQI